MNKDLENKLAERVLPIVEQSRPGWNKPHTLATVYWMKKLIKSHRGNSKILVTAAYMHDIGYIELIENEDYRIDEVFEKKEAHMQKGAELTEEVLNELGGYSPLEIMRISHLVSMHDNLDNLDELDELLIFEADTLGQIDSKRVPYTLNKEDYTKFYNNIVNERKPLFRTEAGKEYLKELLGKLTKPEDYKIEVA